MTRTITRTYDSYAQANAAVAAVREVGIEEADISVVAHKDHPDADSPEARELDDSSATGTGATVGGMVGGGAGLLAGLGMMAIPGVGPLVAAGWLATTAAGAVAGAVTGAAAGGLTDMLTSSGVAEEDAEVYAEAIRRGAIMVAVRVMPEDEADVVAALDNHRPTDLAARRSAWAEEGWKKHDPAAAAFSSDQMRSERARYM